MSKVGNHLELLQCLYLVQIKLDGVTSELAPDNEMFMARLLFVLLLVVLGAPVYFLFFKSPPSAPEIDLDEWWGPDQLKTKQDTSIKPFKIKFDETMIKDLKDRLKSHRPYIPPLEGVGFEYGFNSKQMNSWVKYWAEEYPFAAREQLFNKYPQFKTNIQGLDIHFIRVKPEVPAGVQTVPLLLLHGWPGSVREFDAAIPLLTAVSKDRDFALELIVPSLPGYGFSSPAVRPGLGADKMAVVFRNLMHRLGFKKFYVQGGDWGGIITGNMATLFPQDVLGYHSNIVFSMTPRTTLIQILGSIYPPLVVSSDLADRMYPLSQKFSYLVEEMGYLHIQSTKPDTVGVALTDSPSGLLAYILEKFSTWTKPEYKLLADGGLYSKFTKEQLIDNLMMYWATNSITTSMRLYSETFNKRYTGLKLDEVPTPVPTWLLQAKNEISYLPGWIVKSKYVNLINETIVNDGGHFFAMEMPKFFAEDVLKAIGEFRKWHKQNNIKTEL
ncbi:Juvenile hormone epoxide hydrolase [Papilio xuthus]|uniref:microsomal epoxide hydrolase n=1 Tax=Papilio xuthus TaxID=66420 RepID=A0A194PZ44_PAPXU|nr:Juvenile hormone epoxide hydrolase [Papilio xuthus]